MNSVARVFLDTHMGLSFDGLNSLMRKAKFNTENLDEGDFVMFLNRKCTAYKVLKPHAKVIVYQNFGTRRVPLDAIQYLPRNFGGSKFEFEKAVEKALRSKINFDS